MKIVNSLLIAVLSFVLVACGTTNTARDFLGFEGEYVDACAPAEAFEEKALCSVKVYRGSLEIFVATVEADPDAVPDSVIQAVASVEARATPAADLALQALQSYIEVRDEYRSYRAQDSPVPEDLIERLARLETIARERYREASPLIRDLLSEIRGEL